MSSFSTPPLEHANDALDLLIDVLAGQPLFSPSLARDQVLTNRLQGKRSELDRRHSAVHAADQAHHYVNVPELFTLPAFAVPVVLLCVLTVPVDQLHGQDGLGRPLLRPPDDGFAPAGHPLADDPVVGVQALL
jgi:hypothetical protein